MESEIREPVSALSVAEVMSSPVTFVSAELHVAAALQSARDSGVHHLPVGSADHLVGVVCTCDLRSAPLWAKLSSLVRTPAGSVPSHATCEEASRLMARSLVGSVLVVEAGTVAGILTRADLARYDAEGHLDDATCVCCGLAEHLALDAHDQLLCVECRERARSPQDYDSGLGG